METENKKIKKVKKPKKEKVVKDRSELLKKLLIVFTVLLVVELILIPFLYLAEVKKILPIMAFIIIPTICGICMLLLARNCTFEYNSGSPGALLVSGANLTIINL